jgi:hypothetical protein
VSSPSRGHRAISRADVLRPKHKYYGVALPGLPKSLKRLHRVGRQVDRTPDVAAYFLDWTHRFHPAAAQRACDAGVVPSLTWESWSWENRRHGSPAVTQPKYAPRRIAAGAHSRFIRRTARAIRSLHCPLMLRLDQEANGHWYPWGLGTRGMHNKARQYVAMWRHVWRVFHREHVHNVIWVWSPNYLYSGGIDRLRDLYPGRRYVDMVGIDGYLLNAGDTPSDVFGPVMKRLNGIAPHKPWYVAETGAPVGSAQPGRIRAMLSMIASNRRLVGFTYLDERGTRANWAFSGSRASVKAFREGIASAAFRHARF